MKVYKNDIIKELENEVKGESVSNIVNAFLDKMVSHFKQDDIVTLKGFGTFKPTMVAARKVTCPTGDVCDIPAHKAVKAHMSKDVLNG